LRGRLVDKQGRSVGLAGLAGLAEGASQALGSRGTIVTTGAGTELLTQSGSRGFSSSLDRIAEVYLERADRLSPVLELAGSREVTFALVRGVSLATAKATATQTRERRGS
jgi:conjugal transfer pilus assembly protein TraB